MGMHIKCKIVLDIFPKPPGFHTTACEPKCAHLRVTAFNHTTKIPRNDPQGKNETVAGDGKKTRNFGRSGSWERGSGGGGVRGSAQILDAPTKILNTHRTFTPQHTTTQQNTQGGLGQGRSLAGKSMAQKTRHEQQIVPKSSPIGQGFLESSMVRKGFGTKRFDQKKEAKSGAGQKWSEKHKRHGKTNKKHFSPSPKTKPK